MKPTKAARKTPVKQAKKGSKTSDNPLIKLCRADHCKEPIKSQGYCRLHYISHWKYIKLDDKIKAERRLNAYVDRLVKRYPGEYLDVLKGNIEDESKFKETIEELDVTAEPEETENETESGFLEKLMRTLKDD